ncbi:MAG: TolC family outer membrane protein [Candidatus Polarisedimenticolaceae bacterium]|nr:TolC family outer membrane protein [Candidatus Polarisedimenticolaceae bacterium]
MMKRTVLATLLSSLVWVGSATAMDLMSVYRQAQQSDLLLQTSTSQLDSVRESKNQSTATLLPNISLNGQANIVNREIVGGYAPKSTDDYSDQSLTLNLQQPLYHRDYWIQLEQSDHAIAKAEAEFQSARLDLMVRTTQAYFDVLSASDDLRVSKAQLEATQRQLDQAKQRFEVGLIAITDVHEAQATFDRDRAGTIQAENAQDNAWEALLEILGGGQISELSALGVDMPLSTPNPANVEDWSTIAQQQNFAIIAARSATKLAQNSIALQRTGHHPTVDLVGSYGLSRTDSDTGSDMDIGMIGIQLSLPLYAGGGTTSRVTQAQIDYRTAQSGLDRQRRAVKRQVRNAYRGVLSSVSQVEALKAATVSAKSALTSTEAGYEVGTRTIVDVLNMQRNLFDSQRNYYQSRYTFILNSLLLKQAAGTLLKEDLERVNGWLMK